MKKLFVAVLLVLALAAFATAQITTGSTDVLGAHLNYGRGCAGCHAPHNGASGNGDNKSGDLTGGQVILWGQDVGALYGKQITTGSTNGTTGYVEVLPANMTVGTPDVTGLLTCLSCHDGNWATGAMMKNKVFETLPATYGALNTIPTLLGGTAANSEGYLAQHPVGLNAAVSCGGQWNWDCTETNGVITMGGTNSKQFVTNYGFFVSLSAYNNTAVVTCTSCHNQHLMNLVKVTQTAAITGAAGQSGLPSGTYATMFFVRAPYNPASGTGSSNQTAQFCRQCHGGEANESNNSTAVTTF